MTPPSEQAPHEHTQEPHISKKKPLVTHLTVEGMGFQKPREQTQFQVCSHHMETGEELCEKATVPALELRGPEWIR